MTTIPESENKWRLPLVLVGYVTLYLSGYFKNRSKSLSPRQKSKIVKRLYGIRNACIGFETLLLGFETLVLRSAAFCSGFCMQKVVVSTGRRNTLS